MTSKHPDFPTFRLSAWSAALMAVFAASAYVGSLSWGRLPQVLYMAFGASVAWVVAAYTVHMSTLVKALILASVTATLVLGLVSVVLYP